MSDDWLTDIFFHSEGGTDAVCAVCKQHKVAGDQIFPICDNCDAGYIGPASPGGDEPHYPGAPYSRKDYLEHTSRSFPSTRGFNPQHKENPRIPKSIRRRRGVNFPKDEVMSTEDTDYFHKEDGY